MHNCFCCCYFYSEDATALKTHYPYHSDFIFTMCLCVLSTCCLLQADSINQFNHICVMHVGLKNIVYDFHKGCIVLQNRSSLEQGRESSLNRANESKNIWRNKPLLS